MRLAVRRHKPISQLRSKILWMGKVTLENEVATVMCPPQICGVGVGTLGSAGRRAESRAHLRDEPAYNDASHARCASSSRQTGLGPGASFSVGGGSQRRSAASHWDMLLPHF